MLEKHTTSFIQRHILQKLGQFLLQKSEVFCITQKFDFTFHSLLFSLLHERAPSYSCWFLKLSLYKDSWNIQIFFFINSSTVNVHII